MEDRLAVVVVVVIVIVVVVVVVIVVVVVVVVVIVVVHGKVLHSCNVAPPLEVAHATPPLVTVVVTANVRA